MKPKFQHRRFKVKRLRTISLKGGWSEVDFYEPVEPEPPKPPAKPLPDDAKPMVSENGDFVYFSNGKCWTCLLTKDEAKLAKAIAEKTGWQMDWEKAFAILWPEKAPAEKPLRDVFSNINAKLKDRKFPVRFSLTSCMARIIEKSGI